MARTAQIEVELRELAGLLSDPEAALAVLPKIRSRLHGLADRVRTGESPYLTKAAAARRYGIDAKDFRELIEIGQVRTVMIAGRERVDIRQFE